MSTKFHKNGAHCKFETKSAQVFNFESRYAIWNIIFMINKLELLWLPNFVALEIYFIFWTIFSWNDGIDTYFNVEYVLLGLNFDFLGGYLVVTARYRSLLCGYCSLLLVTARYRSLLLVPTFIMNVMKNLFHDKNNKTVWVKKQWQKNIDKTCSTKKRFVTASLGY